MCIRDSSWSRAANSSATEISPIWAPRSGSNTSCSARKTDRRERRSGRLSEDRTTVPLSPEGARILAELVGNHWFETEVAAFQCAFALALAQGLSIDRPELRGATTKFNVGSLD